MTKAELDKLRSSGATVKTVRQAPKKAEPEPKLQDSLKQITDSLSQGQMQMAEALVTAVRSNAAPEAKPIPYRFIIKRNKRGLMEEVEAYPITEDQT